MARFEHVHKAPIGNRRQPDSKVGAIAGGVVHLGWPVSIGFLMEMNARFRGYLPVVLDLETGGFDREIHAVLEIAALTLDWEEDRLVIRSRHRWAVAPHPATTVEAASLRVTGIDLDDPHRMALSEDTAIRQLFKMVRVELKRQHCQRAIVTAHNAHFDHGFLHAAAQRNGVKRSPFHPFSVMDTVGLAGVAYGHTVLSEACRRASVGYDTERAHSAVYDAEVTAKLFCAVVNGGISSVGLPRPA